ncbi:hypothetical protein QG37_06228 [Candidozyma auris]|uniref:Uncharacterized protein n=1 Tax=Candidozyma auris TaxID=498019 RepID=A0A0L0NUU5_CANAR|nr:hypothetical protein QG37_06228 [[Candida] auris]
MAAKSTQIARTYTHPQKTRKHGEEKRKRIYSTIVSLRTRAFCFGEEIEAIRQFGADSALYRSCDQGYLYNKTNSAIVVTKE